MLTPLSHNIADYLQESEYIDHQHPDVAQQASDLSNGLDSTDHLAIAQKCFEYVLDEIRHTAGYKTIYVDSLDEVIYILQSDSALAEVNKNLPDKISTIS